MRYKYTFIFADSEDLIVEADSVAAAKDRGVLLFQGGSQNGTVVAVVPDFLHMTRADNS